MASKELQVQTNIKKSIRQDGGYAIKLSNRFLIGVPDLLVCLAPFAPAYCEVKDLGEVYDKFDVQIPTTPKQRHEMRIMSEVYEKSDFAHPAAFVLVAFFWREKHYLVGLPRDTERLNYNFMEKHPWATRDKGGYYPLKAILEGLKMIKVRL